jgi:MSHA biogenesis protein MshM
MEPRSLFLELAAELEAPLPDDASIDEHKILKAITHRLLDINLDGKRVVICLDEAQAMPLETLEALRLLSNLETEKRKLLQVVIFGQPELDDKLNHPSIRQLKQRIAFDFRLPPLSGDELDYYIHHRLVVAGYQGGRLFTPFATRLLIRKTKRVPRLVNILAHKALLSAYGKGKRRVGFFDVLAASSDTASVQSPRWMNALTYALIVLVGSGIVRLGWVYMQ